MGNSVAYLGHATTLISIDGVRLLTDPVLRDRVLHLRRRSPSIPPPAYADVDAILVSHGHADHLDVRSLRAVLGDPLIVVPKGLGRVLGRGGFTRVEEIPEGGTLGIGGLNVRATPAEHDGRRLPIGRPVPALGYIVEGSSRVYFAGDTDLFDGMTDLGPIDLALLPVAGWGPRVGAGHLDPERAAVAAARVAPAVAVPIHWGTLRSPGFDNSDLGAPPREFGRLVREGAPGIEPVLLQPGEATPVPES
jgi:L-ascorbate metabolism protein UlaG (beta-lactamase superfamily)